MIGFSNSLRGIHAILVISHVCLCVIGALLKAVCVYIGLVSLSSSQSLRDQLMDCWGGGLELHSWSLLPTGSGLGEITTTWQHVVFNTAVCPTIFMMKIFPFYSCALYEG